MTSLTKRLDQLSPEKRALLKHLLKEEGVATETSTQYTAPRNDTERTLVEIWQEVLGSEKVGIHDNFFKIGGDSIQSIQVIGKANQKGLLLTTNHLFELKTVAKLAEVVGNADVAEISQEPVTGEVPLLPVQQWFFECGPEEPNHWNIGLLIQTRHGINRGWLEAGVRALSEHHDILRTRFEQTESGWRQEIAPIGEPVEIARVDLGQSDEPQKELEAVINHYHKEMRLDAGTAMQCAFIDMGVSTPGYLLVLTHQLVADELSLMILFEDLQTAYEQQNQGRPIKLPQKSTSYKDWSEGLAAYAQKDEAAAELEEWEKLARTEVRPIALERQEGADDMASAARVEAELDSAATEALMQTAPEKHGASLNEFLVCAVQQSAATYNQFSGMTIALEGHGREGIVEGSNLTRTVGWFNTLFPAYLSAPAGQPVEALKAVKQQLECIPNRGIGYGLLRYSREDRTAADKLAAMPQPEIRVLYRGQLDDEKNKDRSLKRVNHNLGAAVAADNNRPFLWDIQFAMVGGKLRVSLDYSTNRHTEARMTQLVQSMIATLEQFTR